MHGGTITLDSVEGEGTTVTVRLPRHPDALASDPIGDSPHADDASAASSESSSFRASSSTRDGERPPPSTQHSTLAPRNSTANASESADAPEGSPASNDQSTAPNPQSKRVLVVDDNADVRRYVRSVLEPAFVVIEASDGEEGTTMAREQLPDVILADVMMPGTNGYDRTRQLKDDPQTEPIPIIMVTARADTADEVAGLQAGADDYVTKPFDADVLRQRVGGVLTLQERLRRRLEAERPVETDEPESRPAIEQEARQVVGEHLTDPDFDVERLAEELAMSRSTLYRKLKQVSDCTPSTLISRVRIKEARELLAKGEPVTQVAYAVGYDTLSTFSRVFREEVGVSPSAYPDE